VSKEFFRHVIVGVMIPAILIGLIVGYFLTFRALQPLRGIKPGPKLFHLLRRS
jgi:uncharacterized protein YneF (UPF0154 family)